MRLSVLQENLRRGIATVMPAVAGKSTLPVLANILLSTDGGRLKLSATNLDMGIVAHVGAKVEMEGAITLPAKLLSDMIGGLPNEVVSLDLDTKTQSVEITCGSVKTLIKGIEADEFPLIPSVTGDPLFSLSADEWKAMIDQVVYAAADNNNQPVLAGVSLDIRGGVATFAACTQHRLARYSITIPNNPDDMSLIIPKQAFVALRKLLGESEVSLTLSGTQVVFMSEAVQVTSRTIEGRYPDVDRIIPTTYGTRLVLPTADLRAAVKLAGYVASAGANIVVFKVVEISEADVGNGKLALWANANEIGAHNATIDCLAFGKETSIKLNYMLALEVLAAISTDQVAIELQAPQHPAVFKPVGEDNALHIIMPISGR